MSRTEEFPLETPKADQKPDPRRDHEPNREIADRQGLTRDAAHREMQRFRGVAEYEVRKLIGQRGALREPIAPSPRRKRQKPQDAQAQEVRTESVQSEAREQKPDSESFQQSLPME